MAAPCSETLKNNRMSYGCEESGESHSSAKWLLLAAEKQRPRSDPPPHGGLDRGVSRPEGPRSRGPVHDEGACSVGDGRLVERSWPLHAKEGG